MLAIKDYHTFVNSVELSADPITGPDLGPELLSFNISSRGRSVGRPITCRTSFFETMLRTTK
jgi:hypothetical protein